MQQSETRMTNKLLQLPINRRKTTNSRSTTSSTDIKKTKSKTNKTNNAYTNMNIERSTTSRTRRSFSLFSSSSSSSSFSCSSFIKRRKMKLLLVLVVTVAFISITTTCFGGPLELSFLDLNLVMFNINTTSNDDNVIKFPSSNNGDTAAVTATTDSASTSTSSSTTTTPSTTTTTNRKPLLKRKKGAHNNLNKNIDSTKLNPNYIPMTNTNNNSVVTTQEEEQQQQQEQVNRMFFINNDNNNNNSTNSTNSTDMMMNETESIIYTAWKAKAILKKIILEGPLKKSLLDNDDNEVDDDDNNHIEQNNDYGNGNGNGNDNDNDINHTTKSKDKHSKESNENKSAANHNESYASNMKPKPTNSRSKSSSSSSSSSSSNSNNNDTTKKSKTKTNKQTMEQKEKEEEKKHKHDHQRMVIIAGPHYTKASDVLQSLWKWTSYNLSQNSTKPILNEWVWPMPLPVAHAEYAELENTKWTPASIFYPILGAVRNDVLSETKGGVLRGLPQRLLFQKYESLSTIFTMFKDNIVEYWDLGYNIILGTEAWNHIVTYPDIGVNMTKKFLTAIMPSLDVIKGEQVTVVVLYRMSKVDHLVSFWSESQDITFVDWIKFGSVSMYSLLDALGMVEVFLEYTDWDVALIDMKGVEEENWDLANFISCKVMGSDCDENGMVGFDNEEDKSTISWEVEEGKDISLTKEVLNEMEEELMAHDCNYMELIEAHSEEGGRLTIYSPHPSGIEKTIDYCETINTEEIPDREKLKENIDELFD